MTAMISIEDASDLIGLVYESVLEKDQWSSLVGRLIALCPGHVAAVTTFEDAEWRSSHVPTLPEGEHGDQILNVMDAAEQGTLEQSADLHEVMFRRQPLQLGTLFSTRELFSEDEFRNFKSYQETMKPIGAGHYAGIHFSISDNRRAAIMVVENDFDPTEKDHAQICELLKLISPHAIRAARFARALSIAREAAETYAGFMDAIALPLLIVTADGQLQMSNAMGQRLIEAGQILGTARSGRIHFPQAHDTAALYEMVETLARHDGPRSLQIEMNDELVALCICPFQPALSDASGVDQQLFGGQRLFAIFVGARPEGRISSQLVRDAFGLSPKEAEVCGHLLTGRSPAQIATATDRAEKTVRNQIQAVHDKVGVNNTRDLLEALAVFRTVGEMYAD